MRTDDDAGLEPDAGDTGIDQNADSGAPNPDAEESLDDLASSLGWKPKDDWKGDGSKWTDAKTFLKQQISSAKRSKDTVTRQVEATKALLETQRANIVKDYEARLAAAKEIGDVDAAVEAQKGISESKRDVDDKFRVAEFIAKNPWYEENEEAGSIAEAAAGRVAARSGTVEAQLEAAERAVRKAMPELFDGDLANVPAKPTPKTPLVTGGQRSPASPRVKGWNDMPAPIRSQMNDRALKSLDLTRDEYAKAYWQENGQ